MTSRSSLVFCLHVAEAWSHYDIIIRRSTGSPISRWESTALVLMSNHSLLRARTVGKPPICVSARSLGEIAEITGDIVTSSQLTKICCSSVGTSHIFATEKIEQSLIFSFFICSFPHRQPQTVLSLRSEFWVRVLQYLYLYLFIIIIIYYLFIILLYMAAQHI